MAQCPNGDWLQGISGVCIGSGIVYYCDRQWWPALPWQVGGWQQAEGAVDLSGGREGAGQAGGVALCESHGVQQGHGTPFQLLSIYMKGLVRRMEKDLLPRAAVRGQGASFTPKEDRGLG